MAYLPFDPQVFDLLPRPVWIFDDNRKRKLYANPKAVTLWGANDLNELLARDFSDQSAVAKQRIKTVFRRLARGEEVLDRWTFYPKGQATTLNCAITTITLTDGSKALLYEAIQVEVDPTEHRALEALRHTTTMVSLCKKDGQLLFANPAAAHAYPDGGGLFTRFVDIGDARRARRAVQECQVISDTFEMATMDGPRWHRLDVLCTPDPVTGVIALLVNERDVTALIEARNALTVAKEQAEAGARAKDEFLANMSHELRTPLTSVLGYAGLLHDTELDPLQQRHLGRIEDAGSALLLTINDILDLSKLEKGAVELDPRPFELRTLAERALGIFENQASAKNLALRLTIAPDTPEFVLGDPDRIQQGLMNLLGNAIKFTTQGSVTLDVTADPPISPDGPMQVTFSVNDTGIGLSEAAMSRLFQRFTQADATITRQFGGTGLGLAITKNLVELMGGTVGVDSQIGEGARFWISIPLDVTHAPSDQPVDEANIDQSRPLRLLLADDNEANRELISAIVLAGGHSIVTVTNGAEVVEAANRDDYDLILMDIQMPVLDGVSATRAIRALGGWSADIPILALTANVLPEQTEDYLVNGLSGHVAKPIRIDELLAAINRAANSGASRLGFRSRQPTISRAARGVEGAPQ